MPASGVVGFSATLLRLQWFIGGRGESADQKKTLTISLNCGVTHSPGKIEYNCRYFSITFRTQIHQKIFGKKCFRNLQGAMSHRPLTNTSSLKIAAAYYILLGPPGRAQVFPYLSPGPLDFLVVCKNE